MLIFGVGAVEALKGGEGVLAHLVLLGALLAGALAITPWAMAASLRQAME